MLVEIGPDTLLLTYANNPSELAEPGDLVWVPVRQRLHAGLVMTVRPEPPSGVSREQLQTVNKLILKDALNRTWQQLITWCAQQTHTSLLQVLRTALPPGVLGNRVGEHKPRQGRQKLWVQRLPHASAQQDVTERQQHLLRCLDRHGPQGCWLKDLLQESGCSRSPVENLATAGLLSLERRQDQALGHAPPHPSGLGSPQPPQKLTPSQAQVLRSLTAPTGLGGEFLLWGITGSGKTEIYLQAAAFWLAQGRDVLILCPEIGLIPQLLDRCRHRFPDRVLSYSSHLSDGERRQTWECCRYDGPWLVVGTRSAVFLPLALLGLVVLDEEHDTSYKQEAPMPCYHARDVARYRAQQDGACLLLGSATPSLESWRRSQTGACQLLRLRERVAGGQLPAIRVVDMRQELASGQRTAISRPLRDRLETISSRGEQAVLFVPRRGYSPFLSCRSCGEAVMCPHCALALTVHRHRDSSGVQHDFLRCHWCNHRQSLQTQCNHCGSKAFKPFGIGTQQVVELLQQQLPDLRLLRYDHDTTRGKDGHRRILEQFAQHQADVLVGTQMLAKGMDLPNVTMAVVLAADGLMHRPDLRAQEQALQVFLQLAGRAGRGTKPGEVLVQTYAPEHVVVRSLVEDYYDHFLNQEMESRRRHGLVPYVRACLLRLSGLNARTTANGAALLATHLSPQLREQGWAVVGPAPAPVPRVAQRSRWQLLLHGPEGPLPFTPGQNLRALLPRGVDLTIDPDPMHL